MSGGAADDTSMEVEREVALMRKLVLLSLALAIVLGGTAYAQGPSATGSGHFIIGGSQRTFAFNGRVHANGTVRGQAQVVRHDLGTAHHMEINCVNVAGNTATMSGVVTSTNAVGFNPGDSIWFEVVDNGGGGNSDPDQITFVLLFSSDTCVDTGLLALNDIIGGNVQVH